MFSVSPKVLTASCLTGVAILVLLSSNRGGARGGDGSLELDEASVAQIEALITALDDGDDEDEQREEPQRRSLASNDDGEYSAQSRHNHQHQRSLQKTASYSEDSYGQDETKAKRKKKKKMKQERRGEVDVTNDPDEGDVTEDYASLGQEDVVDHNDPERRHRHRITPLKSLPRDEHWPVILKPSYGRVFEDMDLSSYTAEDASYLQERLPEYTRRAHKMSEVCMAEPKLRKQKVKVKTLVWDRRHTPNLVWCQLPKIASSSWNANFFHLGHAEESEEESSGEEDEDEESITPSGYLAEREREPDFHLHYEVFRMFPAPNTTKERGQVFRKSVRFLIVRHPFVRLVSAYRDKILQDKPKPVWFHYEKLQQIIMDRYRPPDSSVRDNHPTFVEFIRFVIDQTEGLLKPKDWQKKVHCWKPFYVSCGVCVHDFQLVLKIESLEEDTKFLATLAGLDQLKKESTWRHNINGTTSGDISLKLFEQLTKQQVRDLYRRYKVDFDLFDYSPQQYIDVARGQ